MDRPIAKYNPSFLSDEELIESFVVRHVDLDLVLETIRENTGPSNQHVLVIGPRGIGKTMLLRRAAAGVRSDPELAGRWYPLLFGEEGYEITTPGEFWLEALFHLARQTGDDRWRATYDDLKRNEADETRLRERALAHLMDFSDAAGKRILVVVENLNRLFVEQMDDDDAWTLRHGLLNEPRLMLLASATTRFEQIDCEGRAMYDLFRIQELAPLDTDECRAVWHYVTGEEAEGHRIRPIQILTGGSPRLLVIISYFALNRSFRELMDELVHLVDEHTEYFKSHLDALPPVERKVFVALADIWDPATAREVADASRTNVNLASSLLKRLADRGLVSVVPTGKRTRRYQVAERLYNIYYLLRRRGDPSTRVRAVVRFMVEFYEPMQLVQALVEIAKEACDMAPDARSDHLAAYLDSLGEIRPSAIRSQVLFETPSAFLDLPGVLPSILGMLTARSRAEHQADEEVAVLRRLFLDKLLPLAGTYPKSAREQRKLMEKVRKAFGEVAVASQQVVEALPDSFMGWYMLGSSKAFTHCPDEAERAFDRATALAPGDPSLWAQVGLLRGYLGHLEGAEEALRKALSLEPDRAGALTELSRVLAAKGEWPEALVLATKGLGEREEDGEAPVSLPSGGVTDVIIAAAAAGHAREALERIEAAGASSVAEPLVVGLRLSLGEEVVVAQEVLEVGRDVAERIAERRAALGEPQAGPSEAADPR